MIAVLLPTRGRPGQAEEAARSAYDTAALDDTVVIPVLDLDDPQMALYRRDLGERPVELRGNMIQRTNVAALEAAERYDIIGWMADDNRFRTSGWDVEVERAMVGFVALNDLFWSERGKPVNVFTTSAIIKALGWFANPGQVHHYMDDTWRVLGMSTDSYVYLPDVICEHLHPAVGKGQWTSDYAEHETPQWYKREDRAFIDWIQGPFVHDRLKVKACLGQ